jgi:regulator of protease activity HflC (stomatin/prohibitin superfamily)
MHTRRYTDWHISNLPQLRGFMFTAIAVGFIIWFVLRCVVTGLYTVNQNERAVVTTFGKAPRFGDKTTADDPVSADLSAEEKLRYSYPLVIVTRPGLYLKFPWQTVYKVSIATQTASIAFDPQSIAANDHGTVLDAVTKDQLNTGLKGQIRYKIDERNLYGHLFGVQSPISHVMGYFVSILRERIANFEAPPTVGDTSPLSSSHISGISINDLRKNLSSLNAHMEHECRVSGARYGINLEAVLITEIDPPADVESALAAINTAHNQVSSEISLSQAHADQKIVQSKKAVEIETLKAQAEVQLIKQLAEQLSILKASGTDAMRLYLRNFKLELFGQAKKIIVEARS